MKKTILLGVKGKISTNASIWLFGAFGLLYTVLGSRKVYEDGANFDSIAHILIAIGFILYSIIIFTFNPFAPKVIISEEDINIKKKVLSKPLKILWTNIHSIEFDQYMIVFHLANRVEEFSYDSNADTSIEIKSSIREVAENKTKYLGANYITNMHHLTKESYH